MAFSEGHGLRRRRPAVRARHRHLQVPASALPAPTARKLQRATLPTDQETTMATINKQILLASRPQRRSRRAQQLQARRSAAAGAAGRPGAGAPPLPEPRPVHARPHERRQELRRSRSRWTQVMIGGTVGEVVESRHAGFAAGDKVVGMGGWQEYSVVDADAARRAAQGRHHARAAVGLPRRGRHAGRHRLVRPGARSSSRRPARRWSSAPPAARSAASSASWPRRAAAARSASPAAPTSAATSSTSSASTPASTTSSTRTLQSLSRGAEGGLPRAASTATSRTSAA